MGERSQPRDAIEWPTVALFVGCYAAWALGTTVFTTLWWPLGLIVTVLAITLHSSLTHEAIHGHPFRKASLNEAITFVCLGLFVPYRRFRDLHLAHHVDSILTDPYDDPETNFLDPKVWRSLPWWFQQVLIVNNTIAGRMLFGPALSIYALLRDDARAIRAGDRAVAQAWGLQVVGVIPVLLWVLWAPMSLWAYLLAAYLAFSILKIRTYLEHRAHERASGRTVVIEDKGLLAFLFLNNNLHVVHHMHPKVAWYELPKLFAQNREKYLTRNDGYYFRSYAEIFAKYFLNAKDPVPHPLWEREKVVEPAE